jgi:methylated-DNA-[protein]-cysteine S-methyltransferase
MPVVTTAENPPMAAVVARGRGCAPAISGHWTDPSEYGQTLDGDNVQAGGMTEAATSRSYGYASTPLGRVLVVSARGALVGLYFDGHERTPSVHDLATGSSELLTSVGDQLDEYFHRDRTRFDLPLRLEGTPFQIAVWSAVLDIPYGQTSAYARVAERVGRPRAARAVGAANGQNPISIVVPCHRLVGSNGALTGYGWGLDKKRGLLELEGADLSWGIAAARPLARSGR